MHGLIIKNCYKYTNFYSASASKTPPAHVLDSLLSRLCVSVSAQGRTQCLVVRHSDQLPKLPELGLYFALRAGPVNFHSHNCVRLAAFTVANLE